MIQMRLSLVVVVMVAAVVAVKATSSNSCPTICPAIYRPQCGSDGKTYGNECTLGIAICKDPKLSLKHLGECRAPTIPRRPCPVICPAIFDPVCGSDGKTYGNDCGFGIASCNDPSITVKHKGECQAPPRQCPEVCPFNFDPVCGSDGKTYANDCGLSIASCNDPSITLKHRGECQATTRPCPDVCPLHIDPVCGSNGKTYQNGCRLSVASCNHPSITFKHDGACEAPPQQCPTICTMEYIPMCGSDGKTYSNSCDLRNAACRDSSITLRHEGRCPAPVDECDQRQCTDSSYQPVCGSDGKTYRNNCAWANAACRDRTLTIKRTGACQRPTHTPNNCGSGICPAVYQPVCGSDGKIYSNRCFFNIAKCKNHRLEQGSSCYIA